jgi:hypothetical protein
MRNHRRELAVDTPEQFDRMFERRLGRAVTR